MPKPKYKHPGAPHYLVAVDLGKWKVGWSAWWCPGEEVQLVACGTYRAPRAAREYPRLVADSLREEVLAAIRSHATSDHAFLAWVCEWPKKYPTKRKYHENIDALHAVGRALAKRHPWAAKYLPGQWKGNVPKAAHHRRLGRALEAYLDTPPPEADHDTWDALGIGAYALGLTKRGGVV